MLDINQTDSCEGKRDYLQYLARKVVILPLLELVSLRLEARWQEALGIDCYRS